MFFLLIFNYIEILSFGRNSVSTEVDEIEKLDFTSLYENIAVIYDFFDEEISKTGNYEEVEGLMQKEFNVYEIYRDNFLQVNIDYIFIKEKKINVIVDFDTNIDNSLMMQEGELYLNNYFNEGAGRNISTKQLSFLNIKNEIIKRWKLYQTINQFQKNGYYSKNTIDMPGGHYLYKTLDIPYSNILTSFSAKKQEKYYEKLEYYFNFLKKLLAKDYKLVVLRDNLFSITNENGENFYILIYTEHFSIGPGIYFGVTNIPFEKVDKMCKILDENIVNVKEFLVEKKEVLKAVKNAKHTLWLALDPYYIPEQVEKLTKKYSKLSENGDEFADIAIDLLSNIKLDVSNIGSIINYDVNEYNKLLDAILKKNYTVIVNYYKDKLVKFTYSDDRDLVGQILTKLTKLPDNERISIFYNIENISVIMTREHIDLLMDSVSDENKKELADQIYSRLLYSGVDHSISGLGRYKNIHKHSVSKNIKYEFYDGVVNFMVFICFHLEEESLISKSLREMLEHFDMIVYIDDMIEFERDFSDVFYNRFYKKFIKRYKYLITKIGKEDFNQFWKLDEDNYDTFIENILIPHILSEFHANMDEQLVMKYINMLKQGYMIEILLEMGYPEVVRNIVFQSWNEEKHCDRVIKYRNIMNNISNLPDYNMSTIDEVLTNKFYKIVKFGEDIDINQPKPEEFDSKIDFAIDYLLLKNKEEIKNSSLFDGLLWQKLIDFMSNKTKINLCKVQWLPDIIFAKLAKDKDDNVLLSLINNQSSFSDSMGYILVDNASQEVVSVFLKRFQLTGNLQKKLAETETGLLGLLETQKTLKGGLASEIARNASNKVKMELLNYSNKLKDEIQYILVQDSNEDIVIELLSTQESITSDSGIWIVTKGSDRIKKTYIRKYKISADRQEYLAKDTEEIVLYLLRYQTKLRGSSGAMVAKHSSIKVKRRLAEWNLSEEIALKLAKKETDEELLLNLISEDKKEYYTSVMGELAKEKSEKIGRRIVSGFKTLNSSILQELVNHSSLKVRRKLASWDLSEEIALKLAKKETDEELLLNLISKEKETYYTSVMVEVAKNKSEKIGRRIVNGFNVLDSHILSKLVDHSSLKVRKRLACWELREGPALRLVKKETDEELLLELISEDKKEYYTSVILELAKEKSEKIGRRIVTGFKNLSPSILYQLVDHVSLKVRRRLAKWDLHENAALKLAQKETDEELLLNLISEDKKEYYTSVVTVLAKEKSEQIGQRIVTGFKNLSPSIVEILQNHPSEKIRNELNKKYEL